jgi:hypothetical protein
MTALIVLVQDITRDGAREDARRELSKSIYHRDDPSLLERLVRWVVESLGRLLDSAYSVVPGQGTGLLFIAVLVVAIVIAARLGLGPLRAHDVLTDRRARARAMTASDYRAEAELLAGQGAWREAVRARFRAVIRELEERGVLDPRPGRTAGEVAAEAGAAVPGAAAPLKAAADVFDEIWYGGRPAREAGYQVVAEADSTLRGMRLSTTGTHS